jgi:hypothetical protein
MTSNILDRFNPISCLPTLINQSPRLFLYELNQACAEFDVPPLTWNKTLKAYARNFANKRIPNYFFYEITFRCWLIRTKVSWFLTFSTWNQCWIGVISSLWFCNWRGKGLWNYIYFEGYLTGGCNPDSVSSSVSSWRFEVWENM